MNEEKQIEELANSFYEAITHLLSLPTCRVLAKDVIGLGYRKQSEGEWEIVKGSNGKEIMVCTNCRHSQDLHSTFTYCPNCGARMHGAKMKGGAE